MPDPLPAVPMYGEDYKGTCPADPSPCALCARPGVPCEEWMGGHGEDGYRWCPRCGWARRFHPDLTEETVDA